MSYAIIGLGKIGTAIAHAFADQDIEVAVAGRRSLDAVAVPCRRSAPATSSLHLGFDRSLPDTPTDGAQRCASPG
jgi:predicted dinucleotide-binding enzyme